jgi:PAS domain S-box-containing protein
MSRPRIATFLPIAVALAGLLGAGAQAVHVRQVNHEVERERFESAADQAIARLRGRFASYERGLRGARALVLTAGGDALTREQFKVYSTSRDYEREFPGALGFGVAWKISDAAIEAFVAKQRAAGRSDFTLRELGSHDRDHVIVTFIEPEEPNVPALGLDLASEPSRREAALASARSGEAVLTAPISLLQTKGAASSGLLFMLPVYRAGAPVETPEERERALLGWTYCPLSVERILESFENFGGDLALEIREATGGVAGPRFYATPGADEPPFDGLIKRAQLPMHGREWTIDVRARRLFVEHLGLESPISSVVGIGLGAILFAVLLHAYLRDVDRRLSAALEHSQLAAIVEGSSDGVIGITIDGVVTSWNAAAEKLLGWAASEAIGVPLGTLVLPEDRAHEIVESLADLRKGRAALPFTTVLRHSDGTPLDVSVAYSPIKGPEGRVIGVSCAVRDIRAEKEAEGRLRELNATLEQQVEERTRALAERNQELLVAHHDLQNLVDAVPYAMLVVDERGAIEVVNARAELVFGRPREALLRATLDALVPERFRAGSAADPRVLFSPRELRVGQPAEPFVALRADGSEVPIEVALSAMTTTRGPRTVVAVLDITERRRQDALIQTYAALQAGIFANAGVAIFALDTKERITLMNLAAEALSGYSVEELQGDDRPTLIVGLDERIATLSATLGRPVSRREALLGGDRSVGEVEVLVRRKDGRRVPAAVRIAELRGGTGELLGYVLVVTDLTERKRVEDALRGAMEASDAANRAKSEFIANMSHEIRTPMNAILGFGYLLEKAELPASARATMRKIHSAGRSLLAILNDILDFSKIEAGRLELERVPFRLTDVLSNLATMLSASTGYKPVEVIVGPAPPGCDHLYGDSLRLSQVLTNLATNAVKFTESGEVVISVASVRRSAGEVSLRFSVKDTGMGIPKEKRDEIFSPFSQVDSSTTRKFGGTGLGLAITKRLIALMGGALAVESAPGEGSEFSFDLRFQPAAASKPSVWQGTEVRALIVEDHPTARSVLAASAASLGWAVEAVGSGDRAIEVVKAANDAGKPFAVVFVDASMKGLGGMGVAARIKALGDKDPTVVVLMVTAAQRSQVLESLSVGLIDEVVLKPVTSATLSETLSSSRDRRGENPTSSEQRASAAPRLVGMRVLVVDDREINREVASRILEEEGAEVLTADDGQAALEMLGAAPERFDAVLMDVQMPVMDGYEATRQIRQNPALRDLPVLALTAGAFRNQHDAAIAAGMDGFIPKAFDVGELVALLQRVRHQRRSGEPRRTLDAVPGASAAPPSDPELPSTPPDAKEQPLLDVALGLSRLRKETVFKKCLDLFRSTHPDDEDKLRAHLESGALVDAASLSHKLKGAAASLALTRVATLAAVVERETRAGNAPRATAIELGEALIATRSAIDAYLGPVTATAPKAPVAPFSGLSDTAKARCVALAGRLLDAVDGGDPETADGLLRELGEHVPAPTLEPIQRCLDEFDFPRAKQLSSSLLEALRGRGLS